MLQTCSKMASNKIEKSSMIELELYQLFMDKNNLLNYK